MNLSPAAQQAYDEQVKLGAEIYHLKEAIIAQVVAVGVRADECRTVPLRMWHVHAVPKHGQVIVADGQREEYVFELGTDWVSDDADTTDAMAFLVAFANWLYALDEGGEE